MKSILAALLFSCHCFSVTAANMNAVEDIFNLSLEELQNVTISTGSLLGSLANESPSAITIIRRDQIEVSTAKNLATLLEQHVPGLMLMAHSEGDKIGIRGLIAAENYKLLLLVNGKNITNMVYEGAILELDQWDMNDIEQVEVVRGPGSVTYGTGAIAGVINIITKSYNSNLPTTSVSYSNNPTYRSSGVNMQYANKFGNLGIYSFVSFRATEGLSNPNYFALDSREPTDNRYVGKRSRDSNGPQDYLADSLDRPQIKAYVDLSYGDDFKTWLRYTQSGQAHHFTTKNMKRTLETQPKKGSAEKWAFEVL